MQLENGRWYPLLIYKFKAFDVSNAHQPRELELIYTGLPKRQNRYIQDLKGWHGTFAFKSEDQVGQAWHVAAHAYTDGKEEFSLVDAVHIEEKPDDSVQGGLNSGKVVWPTENELEEYVDCPIGYSHLSEDR